MSLSGRNCVLYSIENKESIVHKIASVSSVASILCLKVRSILYLKNMFNCKKNNIYGFISYSWILFVLENVFIGSDELFLFKSSLEKVDYIE